MTTLLVDRFFHRLWLIVTFISCFGITTDAIRSEALHGTSWSWLHLIWMLGLFTPMWMSLCIYIYLIIVTDDNLVWPPLPPTHSSWQPATPSSLSDWQDTALPTTSPSDSTGLSLLHKVKYWYLKFSEFRKRQSARLVNSVENFHHNRPRVSALVMFVLCLIWIFMLFPIVLGQFWLCLMLRDPTWWNLVILNGTPSVLVLIYVLLMILAMNLSWLTLTGWLAWRGLRVTWTTRYLNQSPS